MLSAIVLLTCIICFIAYRYYGNFLELRCGIDETRETPACAINDGVDYVPTRASVLFGHHFSSIAGAGPIVGPIIAAAAFGWGPTWLWILFGAIFVGGVHDFGSTVMSLHYRGRSIVETCRNLVGETTGRFFLIFVLLALVYVIIVFLDLTAGSFLTRPAVATSSGWFVLSALGFGAVISRTRIPFRKAVPIFILITYSGLAVGHFFPLEGLSKNTWLVAVLVYCYVAAILPVNVLMQPRDFLSATFLYAIIALGIAGLLFSNASSQLAMTMEFDSAKLGMMIPFLFITVACGACSGFHRIVCSGTTSKQIRSEGDIKKITYGGMLVEGVLATFAVACVAVLGEIVNNNPVATFAQGAAVFFSSLGFSKDFGVTFAMLAVSTFLLTTLDTCTRLTRFLVEELFNWHNAHSRYFGTFAVLIVPALFAFQTYTAPNGTVVPAWRAIWPLFGATNQLLAALALVTFTVFLKSRRIAFGFALIPAVLMVCMPMLALGIMSWTFAEAFLQSRQWMTAVLGTVSLAMFLLGLFVVSMSARFVGGRSPPDFYEPAKTGG